MRNLNVEIYDNMLYDLHNSELQYSYNMIDNVDAILDQFKGKYDPVFILTRSMNNYIEKEFINRLMVEFDKQLNEKSE